MLNLFWGNNATLSASIDKTATIVGQPVKLTAMGSGGSDSGYLYKYELLTGGNTVLLKDFGSEASFIHSPGMSRSYLINIYMKDVASVKEYDAVQTVRFETNKDEIESKISSFHT